MLTQEKKIIGFIKDIEKVNLNSFDAYEILLAKFQALKMEFQAINLLPHKEMFLVRARVLENTYDYLENASDHSYNPNTRYITYGRANNKHQSIFYASRDALGATLELKPFDKMNKGDEVTMAFSRWQSTKELKFIALFNPRDLNLIAKSEMKEYVSYFQNEYEKIVEGGNTDYLRFYEYISNKFSEDINYENSNKYKLTAAFSNYIYKLFPDYGGIIFQSVQANDRYNFAIKKEFIDDKTFIPTNFMKVIYARENDKEIKQKIYIEATSFDKQTGAINWW